MSKIVTLSRFYFGTTVSTQNRSIDFNEGGSELQATLKVGAYSVTEYAAEWQRALREAGTQAYVVAFNRTTQKITVSAPLSFTLLRATGTRLGTSTWTMSGFGTGLDLTGTNSYLAPNICGQRYDVQFPVNNYTDEVDSIVKENATVNTTPAGLVQMVSFGDGTRVEMNIRVITNKLDLKNANFVENANGVSDARNFMAYLLTKGRVEFMKDKTVPSAFLKCFLEGTKEDKDGRKFVLKNMKVPDFYETGTLTFRKVLA